jgi:hypothetical protein
MTPMLGRQRRFGLVGTTGGRRYWWMPTGFGLAIAGGDGLAPCGRRTVTPAHGKGMVLVARNKR